MRAWRFSILLTSMLAVGGCSHFAGNGDGPWQARVSEPAPTVVASAKDDGWRPVAERLDDRWSRPKVVKVSYEPQAETAYRLDTGDKLRIFVYGQENLSRLYTVDGRGRIMMPLIGIVTARGLTTYALASRIRAQLGARYVRDPQVTVDVHENRPFYILGEVRQPGKYPYVHGMTIEMAVAIAGGYTARANERSARVGRKDGAGSATLDGDPTFLVRPGDTITIEERFF